LSEDEYFVLHAASKPIEISAATPKIQGNLVRILRFISCERTAGHTDAPAASRPKPG
jgi:hypothetical protein